MLMYIGHLNTVVSISLVSGAKDSASAPMAIIYLNTYQFAFPIHLSSLLFQYQLYVSRCQVLCTGRSIALEWWPPSVLLIEPIPTL